MWMTSMNNSPAEWTKHYYLANGVNYILIWIHARNNNKRLSNEQNDCPSQWKPIANAESINLRESGKFLLFHQSAVAGRNTCRHSNKHTRPTLICIPMQMSCANISGSAASQQAAFQLFIQIWHTINVFILY